MFAWRYKVINGCIHLRTTGQEHFYSTIFQKGLAQRSFLGVALLANNLYSVPGCDGKSTRLDRGCILQFIWSQESREQLRRRKSFPGFETGFIAHSAFTVTLAAKRQSGSDPSMSLITTRTIR
jgi:hypothetical protein